MTGPCDERYILQLVRRLDRLRGGGRRSHSRSEVKSLLLLYCCDVQKDLKTKSRGLFCLFSRSAPCIMISKVCTTTRIWTRLLSVYEVLRIIFSLIRGQGLRGQPISIKRDL